MTALSMRPVSIRIKVAYMATAAAIAAGTPYPDCDCGSTLSRLQTEFLNGYNGVDADHPYTSMWEDIQNWYKAQAFDQLCDAEILDRFNAAISVGFTPVGSDTQVPATAVHTAVKQWDKQGWFRYEYQHAGRTKMAKRVCLFGLAIVGVPMLNDF